MPAHRLDALIEPDLEGLRALRQHLHAHPELGWQEQHTQHVLREQLAGLGLQPRSIAGTGLLVETRPDLPVAMALRADMDALPLQELTGLPYASTIPGCMHACGHDGHMTMVLGAARALLRSQAPVNLRLLFQPAEEGGLGAARMIQEGALEGVPEIYGLHNWTGLPTGSAAVTVGPVMAASNLFSMLFTGQGGHGSQPQAVRDPIVAAAQFVVAAQTVVSRSVHPLQPVVVSFGSIQGGTKGNIIPDQVELRGTIRTLDDDLSLQLRERLLSIARATASTQGVTVDASWEVDYPVTRNAELGAGRVAQAIRAADAVHTGELPFPCMGAEDFSLYLQQRPGAFFFLGSGGPRADAPGVHTATYDFDDRAIAVGVRVFLLLVEQVSGLNLESGPAMG